MKLYECHPVLTQYDGLAEFFTDIQLQQDDLLLTNRFLVEGQQLNGAQVLYKEDFGKGEPSDLMLLAMMRALVRPYKRVVGIGGGGIMDLAKLLCLDLEGIEGKERLDELMMNRLPVCKKCPVILAPATCGTGSEVTNISVLLLEGLNTKMGLANEALYARQAAIIPALLKTLPYEPMIFSAIDALIHATESYLSPKANVFTRTYGMRATEMLLKGFAELKQLKRQPTEDMQAQFLTASVLAGISFGNAGCGMVHAMSFPLSGVYHLVHGEANYVLFLPVLRYYDALTEKAPMENWKREVAEILHTEPEQVLDALEALLADLCPRRSMDSLGADEAQKKAFAKDVWQKQQRLLNNTMQKASEEILYGVYSRA